MRTRLPLVPIRQPIVRLAKRKPQLVQLKRRTPLVQLKTRKKKRRGFLIGSKARGKDVNKAELREIIIQATEEFGEEKITHLPDQPDPTRTRIPVEATYQMFEDITDIDS